MMNRYQIASRSDGAAVSVITINERVDRGHRDGVDVWTLVSTPGGEDVLVDPDGRHIDPNRLPTTTSGWTSINRVTDLINWLVEAL